TVPKLYRSVIEDVINDVRDIFLDDGVDEQVLMELKTLWENKLMDTENVVVCQYDKIHRSKNKWKFHLKDGIMNLNGRDYIFSKAIGDAEW
uniref:Transcription initiation factor IIA subunit 1 n=1 Tax=Homo sapiens TaxID=9606 RepID=UPI000F517944|nr:Chain W, Transcription initiation factor IIA subunit 1 [Homo sapiens]